MQIKLTNDRSTSENIQILFHVNISTWGCGKGAFQKRNENPKEAVRPESLYLILTKSSKLSYGYYLL